MIHPPDLHLDEPQIAREVMGERVRVFIDRTVAGAWSSPLGTFLLAWVMAAAAGWGKAAAWLCLINAVELMIIGIGYRYRRAPPDDADPSRWARWGIFGNALAGLAWGSSVWFFWVDGEFTFYLLNLTVLIGVLGICVVIMSSFQMAMALFSAGVLFLPAIHIAFVENPYGIRIATGLVVLFVLLLQYSRIAGQQLLSGIESAVRNRALAERLDFALGAASDGLWDWNLKTDSAYLSPRYYEMTGFRPDEVTPNRELLKQLVHPEDLPHVTATMEEHLGGKTPQSVLEYRMITRNRRVIWVLGSGRVVERDADGTPLRMVGTISDISERKRMELSLEKESRRSQAILHTTSDGIHILDQDGGVLEANEAFSAMLGYGRDEILHLNASQWDETWSPHAGKALLKQLLHNAAPTILEKRYRRKDGRIIYVEVSVSPVELDGRRLLCCSARDMTDRKRAEEEMRALATTDFLTGLVNRRCFIDRLEEELARFQRTIEQHIALLMLDLDFFKRVNDSYGHPTGDAMLKHFATLVVGELRRIDIAGRLGGEEFGIILPGADLASAKVFAERLCRTISASPLQREGRQLFFTVSIGVTVFRSGDSAADGVLARADQALYRAKELGRNRVEVDAGA
jgi:diguanylate cyclase (GGDEF)-like protein/PAS domain S-box-containing protein